MEKGFKGKDEEKLNAATIRNEFVKNVTQMPAKYLDLKLNSLDNDLSHSVIINRYEIIVRENKKIMKEKKYKTLNFKEINLEEYIDSDRTKLITQFDNFPIVKENYEWNDNYRDYREFIILEYQKNKAKLMKEREKKEKVGKKSCFSFLCWNGKNSEEKMVENNHKLKTLDNSESENRNKKMNSSFNNISQVKNKEVAGVMNAPVIVIRKSNSIVKPDPNSSKNKQYKNESELTTNRIREQEEKLILRHNKNLSISANLSNKKFESNSDITSDLNNNDKKLITPQNAISSSNKSSPRKHNIIPIKKEFSSMKNMGDQVDFPVKFQNKQVDFFLTGDLLKCILWCRNESSDEYILHMHSYNNSRSVFKQDSYILDIYLRTNFENLFENRKNPIKQPLLSYGNVYFPNLTFYRGNFQRGFSFLNSPISLPLVLSQLANLDFFHSSEDLDKLNYQIIKESFLISEALNYTTVIINLINFNYDDEIIHLVKMYIECFLSEEFVNLKNLVIAFAFTSEGFYQFMGKNDFLNGLLIRGNVKARIFQE